MNRIFLVIISGDIFVILVMTISGFEVLWRDFIGVFPIMEIQSELIELSKNISRFEDRYLFAPLINITY